MNDLKMIKNAQDEIDQINEILHNRYINMNWKYFQFIGFHCLAINILKAQSTLTLSQAKDKVDDWDIEKTEPTEEDLIGEYLHKMRLHLIEKINAIIIACAKKYSFEEMIKICGPRVVVIHQYFPDLNIQEKMEMLRQIRRNQKS